MNKHETSSAIARCGVVPVVRTADRSAAEQLIEALISGGLCCIELTLTVPGAAEIISESKAKYGDSIKFGAGTVLTSKDARSCIDAGAEFIVSPMTDTSVIDASQKAGVLVLAGAMTPTEIYNAWQAGADIVKVFPATSVGGAQFIKSVRSVFPDIPLIPTGGVTYDSVESFFAAGAFAVGVGKELADPSLVANGRIDEVRTLTEKFVELIGALQPIA